MEELLLTRFTGVDEALDPELLPEDKLSSMTNMILTGEGSDLRLRKRGGFNRFNSNPVNATGECLSLYDAVDEGGNNYLLAGVSTLLRKSLNGTAAFSDVKTGLTANKPVRIAAYNGRVYITNGVDNVFIIGGVGFVSQWNLGIAAPDTSLVGSGDIAAGYLDANARYKYILVYVSDKGEYSSPSMPFTHYLTETGFSTSADNKKLQFTGIPVSTDSRVQGKIIFRTEGSGEVYYYHSRLSAGETVFYDGEADTFLDLSQSIAYIAGVNWAKYICLHRERLFLANFNYGSTSPVSPAYTKKGASGGYIERYELSLEAGDYSGQLNPGTYIYRFCYVDQNGLVSRYIDKQIALSFGQNGVNIKHLPIMDKKFSQGVQFLRIYRSETDSNTLKILTDLKPDYTITQTNYIDSAEDAALGEQFPSQSETLRSAVIFSEIGRPDEMLLTSVINIFPDDGDEITGIYDDDNSVLVFKKNSICRLYTTGSPANWWVRKIKDNIGLTEPGIVAKNGSEYLFMHQKKIYLLQGDNVKDISNSFRSTLGSVTAWNSVIYYPQNNWYVSGVKISTAYFYLVYDVYLDAWYKFTANRSDALCIKLYGSSAGALLGTGQSDTGTFVSQYQPGTKIDINPSSGENMQVTATFRTKHFTVKDGITRLRLRKIILNILGAGEEGVSTITITDPETGNYSQTTFASTLSGWDTESLILDAFTKAELIKCAKFYIEITGVTLLELGSIKLKFRVLNEGVR